MSVRQWKGDFQSVIRLQVQENPKRIGSKAYARFQLYRDGMTVEEYGSACHAAPEGTKVRKNDFLVDLAWDSDPAHHFISIVKPNQKGTAA